MSALQRSLVWAMGRRLRASMGAAVVASPFNDGEEGTGGLRQVGHLRESEPSYGCAWVGVHGGRGDVHVIVIVTDRPDATVSTRSRTLNLHSIPIVGCMSSTGRACGG